MRISVDREICQGHNRCVVEAPHLFDLDDDLKSVAVVPEVHGEDEHAATAAARNCPERAITLTPADQS